MVTQLPDLLQEAAASPPPTAMDVDDLVTAGRRRVRGRRLRGAGIAALAVGGLALGSALVWTSP